VLAVFALNLTGTLFAGQSATKQPSTLKVDACSHNNRVSFPPEAPKPDTLIVKYCDSYRASGKGKNFSQGWTWRTPPTPDGYIHVKTDQGMEGDRNGCWDFSTCGPGAIDHDGSVVQTYTLQGHEEFVDHWLNNPLDPNSSGRSTDGVRRSRGVVTITYRLNQ